jgi:lysozyme
MLIRDEGRVAHAYQDSLGYWTIGVGHLIDKRKGGKLPDAIIEALLDHDIAEKSTQVYKRFPWVKALNPARQAVLVSMAFQLGVDGLADFRRAMAAMEAGQWDKAAVEFLDSKVAREQSPERWQRHAKQIRMGFFQ